LCAIQYGGYVIDGNIKAIIFNPISLTFPKMADVQTPEVGSKLAPLAWRREIL
jgi:hypothetical protein